MAMFNPPLFLSLFLPYWFLLWTELCLTPNSYGEPQTPSTSESTVLGYNVFEEVIKVMCHMSDPNSIWLGALLRRDGVRHRHTNKGDNGRTQWVASHLQAKKRVLEEANPSNNYILASQIPELGEKTLLLL
jgi:hypothetical protein